MTIRYESRFAALLQYAELFLDEVQSRGRDLDDQERERLAEMLVRLTAGDYECDDIMRYLESDLAVELAGNTGAPDCTKTDSPSISEYRALLQLLRNGI